MASTGRQLLGRSVYPFNGIASIPASTWTVYYRAWHSSVSEDVSTNSPSSIPVSIWSNPAKAYSSDNEYAKTSMDGAMQVYGDYGFSIPANASVTKVEVGYEAYTDGNEKVGITLSWNGRTNWATEVLSPPLETTDPDAVTRVNFTDATSWDNYAVNLTTSWGSYVWNNGTMYVKIVDEGLDSTQTTIDIDFLGVRAKIDGARFTFKNEGTLTLHLVSLWVINSTNHRRYDLDIFMHSANTLSYIRADISLPSGQYTVKVVTERGNIAVYSGS